MEAAELRIGNKVLYGNRIYTIENGRQIDTYLKSFEGINISPDVLVKCGFEKEGEWAVIYFPVRMGIRFYNFNSAECDIIQDDKFIAFKNSYFKYLHQLQNLYYALTKTELNIQL